jgi:UDP-N-acetylmuramate--alanine ligase
MEIPLFPEDIRGLGIYFVGIKGTGMAALAELFHLRGARVSGSDREERFYTDAILRTLGISYSENFSAGNVPEGTDILVYSAAYDPATHPEIAQARDRKIPTVSYTEALGAVSASVPSAGIAGVHGKTTTTALAGVIVSAVDLPAFVLAGSAVPAFGPGSVMVQGEAHFIAETCEYRRHFLDFHPQWLVFTSIEADHLDYFSGYEDVLSAFVEYGRRLPGGGTLIYCSDDEGASAAARTLEAVRKDIRLVPYGFSAPGDYRITGRRIEKERNIFSLVCGGGSYALRIPGEHIALDAVAAFALVREMKGHEAFDAVDSGKISKALEDFTGSRRRSEIVGECGGILFIDDYGHHPTEISRTLAGYREFYPGRRIIVDFMSHTYSRTEALLEGFASAFSDADEVVLHKIYASAREAKGAIDGRRLYKELGARRSGVSYYEEPMDALGYLSAHLKAGDVFVTMGAGNNWVLGKELHDILSERSRLA